MPKSGGGSSGRTLTVKPTDLTDSSIYKVVRDMFNKTGTLIFVRMHDGILVSGSCRCVRGHLSVDSRWLGLESSIFTLGRWRVHGIAD